jgi:hypothetical protein
MMEAYYHTEERIHQGKTLKGIQYSASFDETLTNMATLSAQAYKLFTTSFGVGRSIRSMRYIYTKK